MKRVHSVLFVFLLICSCSKENLFEFKDLTAYEDYIYRVRAYPIDETKPIGFSVDVSQTNGYDQNVHQYSDVGLEVFDFGVTGYKRSSISVYPSENTKYFSVELRKVGFLNDVSFRYFSENSEPVLISYDFETREKQIEYLED